MIWAVPALVFIAAALAWAGWPRRVPGGRGRGADDAHLAAPSPPSAVLRFATFNIHGGKGRDGGRDLSRAAADLEGADVVALQEVHNAWRTGPQHQSLAARLGLAVLHAPSRSRWLRRHRGNALLTRCPVGEWQRFVLPVHPRQRFHFRNLTVARLELHRPVRVLFTHLNRQGGNETQLARVMDEFLKDSPAVLMGDFNMNGRHPALRAYLERGDVIDALAETLDEDDPERIDWILCRGLTPLRGGMIRSGASDHPLYWCDIRIQ